MSENNGNNNDNNNNNNDNNNNNNTSEKTKNNAGINIFDAISSDDAFHILRMLANENPVVARRIEEIAEVSLSGVDIEDVADDVYCDLDRLAVEDVWDNSGGTRYGYVDPTEYAWEMFEKALEPYMEYIKKYQKLSMPVEAKNGHMGILKGIYKFETESTSEYKDWAVDAPSEFFEQVFDEWKKGLKSSKDIVEFEEYFKDNFPDWA